MKGGVYLGTGGSNATIDPNDPLFVSHPTLAKLRAEAIAERKQRAEREEREQEEREGPNPLLRFARASQKNGSRDPSGGA